MAHNRLKAFSAALALAANACDFRPDQAATESSITVKLPPPRPHAPASAFRDVANNRNPAQSP